MKTKKSNHYKSKYKTKKILHCNGNYKPFQKEFGNKYNVNESVNKDILKIFNTPYAPSKITPQSDFYSYINYSWLSNQDKIAKTQAKKFYSQIDSFRLVQEKVYYELMDIIKDYYKNNKGEKAHNIKSLYKSFMNKRNSHYIKENLFRIQDEIDDIINKDNFTEMLAYLNKNEIYNWQAPIVWSVTADDKDSKIYRCKMNMPQLSVYDYDLYIEDTKEDQQKKKYKKEFKKQYLNFINEIFESGYGKNHSFKAADVWEIEYRMLVAMGCNKIKNDSKDFYNIVKSKDSEKYGLDWPEFSKLIGFKKTPNFYICSSLNYQTCILEEFKKNWKSREWYTYYIYIISKQLVRFDYNKRKIYFDFFGKFVSGQQVIFPQEIYPIFAFSLCYNTFLTEEYVRRNKDDQIINYVKNMGIDLLAVYKRIIRRNTWLSPSTKKYALLKLEKIKLVIAQPKKLEPDPKINYNNYDCWKNMEKITEWRLNKLLSLEGKNIIDLPVIDWNMFKLVGTQAYVVNAYYTPVENKIYVPLGYLQKPFIDLNERGIEYNLCHIGYTLGHEMSHSLDDMGSQYDYNGNLKNWWTKKDKKMFNKKVKNVIKQYEKFASYDGIKMDASLSTGENLADISGLAICTEYLRDFQIKNKDINPISYISFEAFFTYIAIANRQKIYNEAIKSQLKINPHPMDKYRTNCPLSRLEIFQSMYNIKKGDKMYWENTDTIW